MLTYHKFHDRNHLIEKGRSVLKSKYSEFSEPLTGVEPMTFQIPVERSSHWAIMEDWWRARSYTDGQEAFLSLAVWQETCIWPCSPPVSHSSVVKASNRYSGGSWVQLPLGALKILYPSISTWTPFRFLNFTQVTSLFIHHLITYW